MPWVWSDELVELLEGPRPARVPVVGYAVAEGEDLAELARRVFGRPATVESAEQRPEEEAVA